MATATTTKSGFEIRRAEDRGATRLGWLESRHSFSFGGYQDPDHMAFRSLRVLNDDWIEPGTGFGEHGHRDMEIITWVLSGALRHADSTGGGGDGGDGGGGGVLRPGDVQVMSAGRGIRHSEMNGSDSERTHFLQMWVLPREEGVTARYDQRSFDAAGRRDRWQVLASDDGAGGGLAIGQDATVSVADVSEGARVERAIADGRFGYLHVAFGEVEVDGTELRAGDAVKIAGPAEVVVVGKEESEVVLFELG